MSLLRRSQKFHESVSQSHPSLSDHQPFCITKLPLITPINGSFFAHSHLDFRYTGSLSSSIPDWTNTNGRNYSHPFRHRKGKLVRGRTVASFGLYGTSLFGCTQDDAGRSQSHTADYCAGPQSVSQAHRHNRAARLGKPGPLRCFTTLEPRPS